MALTLPSTAYFHEIYKLKEMLFFKGADRMGKNRPVTPLRLWDSGLCASRKACPSSLDSSPLDSSWSFRQKAGLLVFK